jgi:hypothetical protein
MVVVAVALPVSCWGLLSLWYCRCLGLCPCFRRVAKAKRAVAPNRQTPMRRAEKEAYHAVHGPFPEVADVRGIVAQAKY